MSVLVEGFIGGGSTDVVNGNIAEYLSKSGTIDPGTFVEFAEPDISPGTMYESIASNADETLKVVSLTSSKAVEFHRKDNPYATVLNISNGKITHGTTVALGVGNDFDVIKLDENRLLLSYIQGYGRYVVILTISGTTISVGEKKIINPSDSSQYGGIAQMALIDNNKFVISETVGTYTMANLRVCTINGSTITPGTSVRAISDTLKYGKDLKKLSNNSVILVGSYSNDNGRNGTEAVVGIINNTSITVGTKNDIYSAGSSGIACFTQGSVAVVCDDLIVIYGCWGNTIKLATCRVSGTSVTLVDEFILNLTLGSNCNGIGNVVLIEDNIVCYCYSTDNVRGYYLGIAYINNKGAILILNSGTIVANISKAGSMVSNTDIYKPGSIIMLVCYGRDTWTNPTMSALVIDCNAGKIKPSEKVINGLTKSKATTSERGEVWVL